MSFSASVKQSKATTIFLSPVPIRYILTPHPRSYLLRYLHRRSETRRHRPITASSLQESVETRDGRWFLSRYAQSAREQPMGATSKEMHMIFLHIERDYRRGGSFANPA